MAHEPSMCLLWLHIITCSDILHKPVQEDASSVAKQHHYPAAGMQEKALPVFIIIYHLSVNYLLKNKREYFNVIKYFFVLSVIFLVLLWKKVSDIIWMLYLPNSIPLLQFVLKLSSVDLLFAMTFSISH